MNALIRISLLASCLALHACGSAPERRPELLMQAQRVNELAINAFEAGRYRDALHEFGQAERHYLGIDRADGAANAAISQAEIFLLLGETRNASEAIGRASHYSTRAADGRLYRRIALLQARASRADGVDGVARWLLEELAEGDEDTAMHARLLRCEMKVASGENKCIGDFEMPEESLLHARMERLRAEGAIEQGDAQTAEAHLFLAETIYGDRNYRPGLAAVHEQRARLAMKEGDRSAARQQLLQALYLRAWMMDRVHSLETLERLAGLAQSEQERQRYREWRELLQDSPDWDVIREAIFTHQQAQR